MGGKIYRIIGNEILTGFTFIAGLWFAAIFHINSRIFQEIYTFLMIFGVIPGEGYYLIITFVVICSLIIIGLIMAKTGSIKGIIALLTALCSSWLFVVNIWFSAITLLLAAVIAGHAARHRMYEGILGNVLVLK